MTFNQTDIGLLLFYIAGGVVGIMILLLYLASRSDTRRTKMPQRLAAKRS